MVNKKYIPILLIFIVITFIGVVYAKLGVAEDLVLEETNASEVNIEDEIPNETQEVESDTIEKRDENIIKDLELNIDKLTKELLKKDKEIILLGNKLSTFTSYGIDESIFNTKNFLFITVILLIVIIIVIALVLSKALSWRRNVIDKVVADGKILQFPHETNQIIKNSQVQISENIQTLANFIAEQIQDTTEKTNQSFEKINNINEQLDIFSKKIDSGYIVSRAFKKIDKMIQVSREIIKKPHKMIQFRPQNFARVPTSSTLAVGNRVGG